MVICFALAAMISSDTILADHEIWCLTHKKGGSMKMFIILISSLIGLASVNAAITASRSIVTKKFTLKSDFGVNSEVYFNCDSVENSMRSMLSKMGATDIHVRCTGGIQDPPFEFWDANVTVSYSSLKASSSGNIDADYRSISIDTFDSCVLLSQLFAEVQDSFDIKDLSGTKTCTELNSSLHLKMMVLL